VSGASPTSPRIRYSYLTIFVVNDYYSTVERANVRIDTPEHDVFLGILRIAETFTRALTEVLEPFRLTLSQYNVLRTLRHSGSEGLTCGEVSQRLSTRDSDITRLLDRLELLGLIARRRDRPDRRVVRTKITTEGTGVLKAIDKLIGELQVRHLGHLGPKRLSAFGALLRSAAITGLVE
jgi:DNA-binding MarR family transcriptional regulator